MMIHSLATNSICPTNPYYTVTSCVLNQLYRGVNHQPARAVKRVLLDGFKRFDPARFCMIAVDCTISQWCRSHSVQPTNPNLLVTRTKEEILSRISPVPTTPSEVSSRSHNGKSRAISGGCTPVDTDHSKI